MTRVHFPNLPRVEHELTRDKVNHLRLMPTLICTETNARETRDAGDLRQPRPAQRSSNAGAQKSNAYRLIRRILRRLQRELVSRRVKQWVDSEPMELVRLGTKHGGWVLPSKTVEAGGTAVCVGAGEDISFDVELNKRGFQVHTLDPTPRAKRHVEELIEAALVGAPMAIDRSPSKYYDLRGFDVCRFRYLDVGVWERDATMRFFSPEDKNHVSHSIVNLQKTQQYFEARCLTMESLASVLNLREFTLLKLDIEGAEYPVLRNLIARGPLPQVLCVDFDEIRLPLDAGHLRRIGQSVQMLKKTGYKFAHMENTNALFLRAN
jgi:hypothetical protein